MIQGKRKHIWNQYYNGLAHLKHKGIMLPDIPTYATNNAHMFYLVCRSLDERSALIQYLKNNNVLAVFHYLSLHLSEYYTSTNLSVPELHNCDKFADNLVRLPLYYELNESEVATVINLINEFYLER